MRQERYPAWRIEAAADTCHPGLVHTFEVWAPDASEVSLKLGDDCLPMAASDGGWWEVVSEAATTGDRYGFVVDGNGPFPDPRSAWQPDGVHQRSAVFAPGEHTWGDGDWAGLDVRGAVLYELHVGTFTLEGTLDAALDHIDHLVALGVDMVQLMPLAAFPGRWGWGYDGVGLYAVHDPYGGPAALQRFVDGCHQAGLAVSLDVVYNHLGPSGNYLNQYGPYFTEKHHTPWGATVNLDDSRCEEVRRYLIDNALRWFREFHFDALRLDAVHALVDHSKRHFLAELSDETAHLAAALGRPLSLIAESDLNDPAMVTPINEGGLGMTAQWSDDFHHAIHSFLTGERQGYYCDFGEPGVLAKTLTSVFLHDGGPSTFRGKNWGAPIDRARHRGHAFLAYTANHDQVGNRALGDRPSCTLDLGRQAVAAALMLCSPFTPMLFMGEEWSASTPWQFFTDHSEKELARAIREGRRREFAAFGWEADDIPDPQDHATRERSVLEWDERRMGDHARLLAWYTDLVAMRRATPELLEDNLAAVECTFAQDGSWFVLHRGSVKVAANLAEDETLVPIEGGALRCLLAFDAERCGLGSDGVTLPCCSVAVVSQR